MLQLCGIHIQWHGIDSIKDYFDICNCRICGENSNERNILVNISFKIEKTLVKQVKIHSILMDYFQDTRKIKL